MIAILLPIGLILLLLALAFLILLLNERYVQRQRLIEERHRTLGLPPGELVYEDADGQGETLSSSAYPLMGKPDYVVKLADGRPVPIELKLNVQHASEPFSNHAVQIGAYCLILEDAIGATTCRQVSRLCLPADLLRGTRKVKHIYIAGTQ